MFKTLAIRRSATTVARRAFSVEGEAALNFTAKDALKKIDFKIPENASVQDAIKLMVANRVGALAVTSAQDKGSIIGVISERDFVNKVALLGKSAKSTTVNEVGTLGAANLITVVEDEPVEACMKKVLASDVRHLLMKDSSGKIVSMLSVKDLVKCVVSKHQELVSRLTDFGTGKGAFFGSE